MNKITKQRQSAKNKFHLLRNEPTTRENLDTRRTKQMIKDLYEYANILSIRESNEKNT